MISASFIQSKNDYTLFTKLVGDQFVDILVYVDDIVLIENSYSLIQHAKEVLRANVKLKDLGELRYFLGMEILRPHRWFFFSFDEKKIHFGSFIRSWFYYCQTCKHTFGTKSKVYDLWIWSRNDEEKRNYVFRSTIT